MSATQAPPDPTTASPPEGWVWPYPDRPDPLADFRDSDNGSVYISMLLDNDPVQLLPPMAEDQLAGMAEFFEFNRMDPIRVSCDWGHIYDGNNRAAAALAAGHVMFPVDKVYVDPAVTEANIEEEAIRINVSRRQLTRIQRDEAIHRCSTEKGWTDGQIAPLFALTRQRVSQIINVEAKRQRDFAADMDEAEWMEGERDAKEESLNEHSVKNAQAKARRAANKLAREERAAKHNANHAKPVPKVTPAPTKPKLQLVSPATPTPTSPKENGKSLAVRVVPATPTTASPKEDGKSLAVPAIPATPAPAEPTIRSVWGYAGSDTDDGEFITLLRQLETLIETVPLADAIDPLGAELVDWRLAQTDSLTHVIFGYLRLARQRVLDLKKAAKADLASASTPTVAPTAPAAVTPTAAKPTAAKPTKKTGIDPMDVEGRRAAKAAAAQQDQQ